MFLKFWRINGITVVMAIGLSGQALVASEETSVEVRKPPMSTTAVHRVPLADVAKRAPREPVVLPDFEILRTQRRRVQINEGPPMTGLPPVKGEISIEVHEVADPGLPDLPEKPPVASNAQNDDLGDSVQRASAFGGLIDTIANERMAFISATVYDHSRTLLRCYLNGNSDKKITVWSNVNCNYFRGMGAFVVKGADGGERQYIYVMGIGNVDVEKELAFRRKHGMPLRRDIELDIPELPDDGPAYVVQRDDSDASAPDPATLTMIDDLHAFYRDEGDRLIESYEARKRANAARRAELLANPPKPKDVKIHFWKRGAQGQATDEKGGRK